MKIDYVRVKSEKGQSFFRGLIDGGTGEKQWHVVSPWPLLCVMCKLYLLSVIVPVTLVFLSQVILLIFLIRALSI